MPDSLITRAKQARTYALSRLRRGPEEDKATTYWGGLTDYHLSNDSDPIAIARPRWLAMKSFRCST